MDFTKNNPAIKRLFSKKFPEDLIHFPNKAMPVSMREEAAVLYEVLFNTAFDPNDFSLVLRCDDGELKRVYGPAVGTNSDENALCLKWGEKVLTFQLDGAKIIPNEYNSELGTLNKLELGVANFGFKDLEMAICMEFETNEEFLEVNFPIRFQDPKNAPTLPSFKTLLKKNPEQAFKLLYGQFEGKSSGGGGGGVNSLTDIALGTPIQIVNYEVLEFTTKKGEERKSVVIIDTEGNKYWGNDLLGTVIPTLLVRMNVAEDGADQVPLFVEVLELAKGKKSQYIALGQITFGDVIIPFGSQIKTQKEKELPSGLYNVLGVDSFECMHEGKSFTSYVYVVESESGEIFKSFVPAKHRDVLEGSPIIDVEHPANFTIYESGADGGSFMCSQLSCEFNKTEEDFDLEGLF